jgi:hypothetical protein
MSAWGGTVHIKTPPGTPPQAPPPEPDEPPELEPEEPPLEPPEFGEFDPCRPSEEQWQGGKDYNDDLCLDPKTMEPTPPKFDLIERFCLDVRHWRSVSLTTPARPVLFARRGRY